MRALGEGSPGKICLKVGLTAKKVGVDDDGPALFKKKTKNANVNTWDFSASNNDSDSGITTTNGEDSENGSSPALLRQATQTQGV